MTRVEFKNIVKAMRGAYVNCPITTQQVFDEWFMLLKDMDYRTVSNNLQSHIKKSKYVPTIAELRGLELKGFNNFVGRNYDMDKLELALLGIRPVKSIEQIKE